MTLAFLNPTRSFDPKRNAVSFLGHDGMFEIRFFVAAEALGRPGVAAASGTPETWLSAFDLQRSAIEQVASRAYTKRRDHSYVLTSADFG